MPASGSRLPLVATGIPGLDDVLHGGVPRGTLLLVEGRPGTGKTTLALQFLRHGAHAGEPCLLVSNAETPEQLAAIARTHGWSLDGIDIVEWREPIEADRDDDPAAADQEAMEYTLFPEAEVEIGTTLERLFTAVEAVQPSLVVVDTISALRVLAPSAAFYRRQLRRIRDLLSARGCTTVILDDASTGEKDFRSQTLADGILELHQVDHDYGEDRRRLRVRKLRGATYLSGAHDFTIVTGGLQVFPRLVAQSFAEARTGTPASSGLATLDALSGGGLPRGSSTVIMGPSGTGKSTLITLFARAAAERGEVTSITLFDENPDTFIKRCGGLDLDISGAVAAGLIRLTQLDPAELSPGQIAHRLVREVVEQNVRMVAVDTLNGYLQSALQEPSIHLHLRELVSFLGRQRVVTLLGLSQHGILSADMTTPVDVSYLADNVFLLRYFEARGGIRVALSMVKKRSGRHERTLREMRMTSAGVEFSEPLKEFTGVLGGMPVYGGGTGGERGVSEHA